MEQLFHNVPYIKNNINNPTGGNKLNKTVSVVMLLLVLTSMFYGAAVADNSYGPAPGSGDGDPSGNPLIRPDNPGMGPAPNSGDGDPDGSGF